MGKMFGILMHLSFNMWCDNDNIYPGEYNYSKTMRFDKNVWDECIDYAKEVGLNTIVIDLGDGVKYHSHPEIGLCDAFTVEEIKTEIARLKNLGFSVLPKLNFSTGHDAWLGIYSRMVSTPTYYEVCKDLIEEVIDIFDKPAYFHLGMDEEDEKYQKAYSTINVRTGDLMWHDLNFLLNTVFHYGVTPWLWADYFWEFPDLFAQKISKDVLLSGWHYTDFYDDGFGVRYFNEILLNRIASFEKMDLAGFKQVPCCSNWAKRNNSDEIMKFCKEKISEENQVGYMTTTWVPTIRERKYTILEAIDLMGLAKNKYY